MPRRQTSLCSPDKNLDIQKPHSERRSNGGQKWSFWAKKMGQRRIFFFYQAHIYQFKVVIMGNFGGGQIPQKVEIRMQCEIA